jgi:hypothetical protein
MDIKKLEGSMSFDDFSNGIVSYGNCKTFGEVWEKCVTCNNCDYKDACHALSEEYDNIKCRQVIDVLLGHTKLEDVIKEDN